MDGRARPPPNSYAVVAGRSSDGASMLHGDTLVASCIHHSRLLDSENNGRTWRTWRTGRTKLGCGIMLTRHQIKAVSAKGSRPATRLLEKGVRVPEVVSSQVVPSPPEMVPSPPEMVPSPPEVVPSPPEVVPSPPEMVPSLKRWFLPPRAGSFPSTSF
ncbi:Beta-taxilin [Liparis tanakae]|uniref:Beta-taxilin n=1 Tax=Liparis tanakae TaxID=230148 RepID=A0A4Z2E1N5_9TELE|nr:Beta-taxilin [Liparis tanakae]